MAKATDIRQAEFCAKLARLGMTDNKLCKCGGLKNPEVKTPSISKAKQ